MAGASRSTRQFYAEVTPTIDTSAYATGELILIGGSAMKFAPVVDGGATSAKLSGILQSVISSDAAKQSVNLDLVLWDAEPTATTFTDQAALAIADADLKNLIGTIHVTDWSAFSNNSLGQALQLALPFVLDSGDALYGALISRGAPTYVAADDITVKLGVIIE